MTQTDADIYKCRAVEEACTSLTKVEGQATFAFRASYASCLMFMGSGQAEMPQVCIIDWAKRRHCA